MRMIPLLLAVYLLLSCAAGDLATTPAAAEHTPVDESTLHSSSPVSVAAALGRSAWDHFARRDLSAARQAVRDALEALGPSTVQNASGPRIQLLLNIANFCHVKLDWIEMSMLARNRCDRTAQLWHAAHAPEGSQAAVARLGRTAHPRAWINRIDRNVKRPSASDFDTSAGDDAWLWARLGTTDDADQLAYDDEKNPVKPNPDLIPHPSDPLAIQSGSDIDSDLHSEEPSREHTNALAAAQPAEPDRAGPSEGASSSTAVSIVAPSESETAERAILANQELGPDRDAGASPVLGTSSSTTAAGTPTGAISTDEAELRLMGIQVLLSLGQQSTAKTLAEDLSRTAGRLGPADPDLEDRIQDTLAQADLPDTSLDERRMDSPGGNDQNGAGDRGDPRETGGSSGYLDLDPSHDRSPYATPPGSRSAARGAREATGDRRQGREGSQVLGAGPGSPPEPGASGVRGSDAWDLRRGDLAYRLGKFDLARWIYSSLLGEDRISDADDTLPNRGADSFLPRLGLARATQDAGDVVESLPLLQRLAEDFQQRFPSDHPLRLEVEDRLAEAILQIRGTTAYRSYAESLLAARTNSLRSSHPAVQSSRAALARAAAEQGDWLGAVSLLAQRLRSYRTLLPDDHPRVSEAQLDLAEAMTRLGDADGARQVMAGRSSGSDPATEFAGDHQAQRRTLWAEAHQFATLCRLDDAVERRRQIVDLDRRDLGPEHPGRAEGLYELAAVLRLTGQGNEARLHEAEAASLGRATAADLAGLETELRQTRAQVARDRRPPSISIESPTEPVGRVVTIAAVIEDPLGVLGVSVLQDGVPVSLGLDRNVWSLDASGTRGRLQLPITLPDDSTLTAVTISAQNLDHDWSSQSSVLPPRTESGI